MDLERLSAFEKSLEVSRLSMDAMKMVQFTMISIGFFETDLKRNEKVNKTFYPFDTKIKYLI